MYERHAAVPEDTASEAGFVPVDAGSCVQKEPGRQEPESGTGGLQALGALIGRCTSRLRLRELSADDLLLMGIVIVILWRRGEWDVLLIMGILFILELSEGSAP